MTISNIYIEKIDELKRRFEQLRRGREDLLVKIDEAELPEAVYNSNAIENSTLTLEETERIILEIKADRNLSLREVFEAKNLARVSDYIRSKVKDTDLTPELILLLHQMLLSNIDDSIAGRFRAEHEYVRVGTHVAPAPEHIERFVEQLLIDYASDTSSYFLEKIARFHLEFERIHPFNDGNGRIGRALMNFQLQKEGFSPIIVRNKGKAENYYPAFREYVDNQKTQLLGKLVALSVIESLHKRLAYLEAQEIVKLTDYAKHRGESVQATLNAARRQTIPAFREKNVWKIGIKSEK